MTISAGNVWSLTVSLICILLCLSCGQSERSAPADLIPQEDMVDIMVDMSLIEAYVSMGNSQELARAETAESFYNGVWEEHGIDEERFERSFAYYADKPEKLAAIFEAVAKRIQVIEDREKMLQEKAKNAAQDREADR